jgi:hypothetical protein
MKRFRCIVCGKGTVRPQARPGRRVFYKTMKVELPADLQIPACDNCGEEWINGSDAKRVDAAAEAAYSTALRAMAGEQLARLADADVEQKRVEQALGLSQGYLSHVKAGRKDPSAMLVSELVLLAKDPRHRLQELEEFWKQRRPAA